MDNLLDKVLLYFDGLDFIPPGNPTLLFLYNSDKEDIEYADYLMSLRQFIIDYKNVTGIVPNGLFYDMIDKVLSDNLRKYPSCSNDVQLFMNNLFSNVPSTEQCDFI